LGERGGNSDLKIRRRELSKIGKTKLKFTSRISKGERDTKLDVHRLECLYLNARSIVNKQKELEFYVHEENIDIIGIRETWLNKSVLDSEMAIEGYTLLRQDRKDEIKKLGGGVALYIRNSINMIHRDKLFETVPCQLPDRQLPDRQLPDRHLPDSHYIIIINCLDPKP